MMLSRIHSSRLIVARNVVPLVTAFRYDSTTSVNVHEHKLTRPKITPKDKQDLMQSTKGSLIPETLKEMSTDVDFQATLKALKAKGQAALTKEERKKRQRALDNLGVKPFHEFVQNHSNGLLKKKSAETLQLNIGIYCNQACSHCHVESSPKRKEVMSRTTADRCVHLLANSASIKTVDVTGGAPELCPEFRHVVSESRKLDKEVIDRCNLTSLLEPGQEDTARFLADHQVQIVASLPCYSAKNVNLQRGSGVFQRSIQALLDLNQLGYGKPDTGLELSLVYNPLGAFLPPHQSQLETKYREELWQEFGIEFNHLYTITNMPIKRFADFLYRRNELQQYMELLVSNFNSGTLDTLMCRSLVSVNHDGAIFDCDFNQQLAIPTRSKNGKSLTVFDIDSCDELIEGDIFTDNHCYGCTAGQGSS